MTEFPNYSCELVLTRALVENISGFGLVPYLLLFVPPHYTLLSAGVPADINLWSSRLSECQSLLF